MSNNWKYRSQSSIATALLLVALYLPLRGRWRQRVRSVHSKTTEIKRFRPPETGCVLG
jgi:hypothetical protein